MTNTYRDRSHQASVLGPDPIQVSGTTYTFSFGDVGNHIMFTGGSAVTATIPPNSTLPCPVNSTIEIEQNGVGQVTVAAGAGVTINSPETLKTAKRYATAIFLKVDTDTWTAAGYFEAA
jgi:hypothetical protein